MLINGKMIVKMEIEFIHIIIKINMMESGKQIMKFGKGIYIYNNGNKYDGNGQMIKKKKKVFILNKMEIHMK